jgi:type III restriction enzyme
VAVLEEPGQVWATSLFGDEDWRLDTLAPEPASTKTPKQVKPQTREQVLHALGENRLQAFARKHNLPTLTDRLKREDKPDFVDLSEITEVVARALPISETLALTAVSAALNRNRGKETHKELTEGASYALDVEVVTDRQGLAKEAMAALQELPHAEEEDYRIVVHTLSARLRPTLDAAIGTSEAALSETERMHLARDAAHWVIRESAQELREAIFEAIANKAKLVDAEQLPDVMIFPQDIGLEPSAKNIYGVLPPSKEDSQDVETVLFMDERRWWVDQVFPLEDGSQFSVGRYDGAVKLNNLEREFARALDGADFVHWWHRNPDLKPYAVRVVRAEHKHYFYPDFVVCVEHSPGDVPMQRLLETKESTKDAARKAKHFPAAYGKVLFLTPDGNRLRWVNDDGSLGEAVKLSEFEAVRQRLIATRPG